MAAVKDNKPHIHEDVTKKRVSRVLKFHYRGEMRSVHESDSLNVIFSPAFLPALTRPPVGECLRRTPRAFAAATELPASLFPFLLSFSLTRQSPVNLRWKGQFVKQRARRYSRFRIASKLEVVSFFWILIISILGIQEIYENWWRCNKGILIAKVNFISLCVIFII